MNTLAASQQRLDLAVTSGASRPTAGKFLLFLSFLLLPWQKPEFQTTLVTLKNIEYVDLAIVLFIFFVGLGILIRQFRLRFYLLFPMAILLGSGALSALVEGVGTENIIELVKELYLYVWFLTLIAFLHTPGILRRAIRFWFAVTWLVGLLMFTSPFLLRDIHYLFYFGVAGSGLLGGRAVGLFFDPNMAANYLVLGSFLGFVFPLFRGRFGQALFQVTLLGGIVASGSNGQLGSWIVGWGCILFFRFYSRSRSPAYRGVVLVGCLCVFLLGALLILPQSGELYHGAVAATGNRNLRRLQYSYQARAQRIDEALSLYFRSPILGIGPGMAAVIPLSQGRMTLYTHNDFLAKLIENGPLGLLGYVWLLAILLLAIHRLRRLGGAYRTFWLGLLGLFTANVVGSLSIQTFHFRHVWVYYAIILLACEFAQRGLLRPLPAAEDGKAKVRIQKKDDAR